MSAAESYFSKTSVGVSEIKVIPAATLIMSSGTGPYFADGNGLFRPLFRYIRARDIPMTTPVEAEIDPGKMYFYIGRDASAGRELEADGGVEVLSLPERKVASFGGRGSYSQANFETAEAALREWLAGQNRYIPDGDARAVFWNGPFMPGLLKRFEVHIPVREAVKAGSDGG